MHQNLLSTALSLFRADPLPAQRLHGGTFSEVYEFTSRGESFILRLTPPNSGIDRDDMESVLHYMHYLSDGGLCVPSPLLSREGRLVEMIPDGDRTWLATVVQKARGVRAETIPFEGWTDRRIHLLGSLTGRMHRLSQGYQPPAEIKPRPGWDKVTNNYNPLDELPDAETDILERRQEVLARLEHLPRTPASFGLIHADLQFANFFIDPADDLLTLYDFDDCCQGWYMMDIALPLLDMLVLYPGHDREVFASRFLEHFITGYRTQCTPDPSPAGGVTYFSETAGDRTVPSGGSLRGGGNPGQLGGEVHAWTEGKHSQPHSLCSGILMTLQDSADKGSLYEKSGFAGI